MSSTYLLQTPQITYTFHTVRMPTCPPPPQRPDLGLLPTCGGPLFPLLPLPSKNQKFSPTTESLSVKRLMPRPTCAGYTDEFSNTNLNVIPESLMEAFGDEKRSLHQDSSEGQEIKRVRRASLLDGVRNRRPSFAGAA